MLTYHASEAMRAKEPRAARLAFEGPVRDLPVVLEVDPVLLADPARPPRLAAVDPGGEVAVLVGPDVVLLPVLPAVQQAVEVKLHLGSCAHALLEVSWVPEDQEVYRCVSAYIYIYDVLAWHVWIGTYGIRFRSSSAHQFNRNQQNGGNMEHREIVYCNGGLSVERVLLPSVSFMQLVRKVVSFEKSKAAFHSMSLQSKQQHQH
jgi:hypothetical protein